MNRRPMQMQQFTISSDHPSLAGHFPGQPVVPGVVLLDHLRACLENWMPVPLNISCFKSVKFLLPVSMSGVSEQTLDVNFSDKTDKTGERESDLSNIHFRCLLNSELVLQGQCIISKATPQ